jgi:hypothetical protein
MRASSPLSAAYSPTLPLIHNPLAEPAATNRVRMEAWRPWRGSQVASLGHEVIVANSQTGGILANDEVNPALVAGSWSSLAFSPASS